LVSTPASKRSGSSHGLKLGVEFYRRRDVVKISRQLLGKFIFTDLPLESDPEKRSDSVRTGGIIVETEAYAGPIDRASHAFANRRTRRTEIMFKPGGVAYVYLCYGIHALFNVITNIEDVPHAVLIRAVQPTEGLEHMLLRRGLGAAAPRLTAGPGALTQALGISTRDNGIDLTGGRICIEDQKPRIATRDIIASPRVGIGYAGPDVDKPWRFRIRGNPWTSPAK
jgi:DNA-3-methyladenine glycosylase